MRIFGITFPLVVASLDYRNEKTTRFSLLRGLATRSIVAPKGQLDRERKLAEWTLCGKKYCMEKQICNETDSTCVCEEGYESDGGQGCQDRDECLSNSTCPGEGMFCTDMDPEDGFYKCGCEAGYVAILPNDYNATEMKAPISFRPESCMKVPDDAVTLTIDFCTSSCDIAEADVDELKEVVLRAAFDNEDTSGLIVSAEQTCTQGGCGTVNGRKRSLVETGAEPGAELEVIDDSRSTKYEVIDDSPSTKYEVNLTLIFIFNTTTNSNATNSSLDNLFSSLFKNQTAIIDQIVSDLENNPNPVFNSVSGVAVDDPSNVSPVPSPAPSAAGRRKLAEQMNEYYMKLSADRSDNHVDMPDFLRDFNGPLF